MKPLSVIELSELYKINRQTIYKRIKKGDLSKNSDGKIDLSEAIRIFGEPSVDLNNDVATLQSTRIQKETEVDILKQQIDILKKQLDLAQEREVFQREQLQVKDEQIQAIQFLLGEPKRKESIDPLSEENLVREYEEDTKPKKGFWSRLFD
ncbi:hypothetical protein P256_02606 [Acinetobacter nectaris CIP 110549]|uniref:Uncharacterized protein n=1 Tax=Acinetobacter nectaris CIP 110549 TaxID=1392540 RepID=V2UJ60_9GAMM|nr:plasmid replication DNA-binding protein [Acinetobacter nectaris]ESK35464.1 hypothetical protein P256_02606 [Acinetobacter nectaris CIP 110549]